MNALSSSLADQCVPKAMFLQACEDTIADKATTIEATTWLSV